MAAAKLITPMKCHIMQYTQRNMSVLSAQFTRGRYASKIHCQMPSKWGIGQCFQPHRTLVEIANRKFLPGSDGANFPQFLQPPRDDIPHVVHVTEIVGGTSDLVHLGMKIRPLLDNLIINHPAVLFKDLPISNANELSQFSSGLGYSYMDYIGGYGTRDIIADSGVMLASAEPPELNIELHNEMGYNTSWPKMVMFFCEIPAGTGCGGETVIADNREVEKHLHSDVIEKFRKLGVCYVNHLPDKSKGWYNSWQKALHTNERSVAEKDLNALNLDIKWLDDGSLRIRNVQPAFAKHYRTGEEVWFSQAVVHHVSYFYSHPSWGFLPNVSPMEYPWHSTYGDGTAIEDDVLQHIRNVTWTQSVGFQMEKHDLIVLDNMFLQHGRISWIGERKLLANLVEEHRRNI